MLGLITVDAKLCVVSNTVNNNAECMRWSDVAGDRVLFQINTLRDVVSEHFHQRSCRYVHSFSYGSALGAVQ